LTALLLYTYPEGSKFENGLQPHGKFPRNHRFVLGERIERNLYDLLEILIRSKSTLNSQDLLQQANLGLEVLRFQMRLAKDLQCLKAESYGFAAKAIDGIGKLVVGWLKSSGRHLRYLRGGVEDAVPLRTTWRGLRHRSGSR
jgi:hypothetical protein